MKRVFLRVYVGVALMLLLTAGVAMVHHVRDVDVRAEQRVEAVLTPALGMMRHRFHRGRPRHGGRERILNEIRDAWGVEAEIIRRDDTRIRDRQRHALATRGIASSHGHRGRLIMADVGPGEVLVLGPWPVEQPGRGIIRRLAQLAIVLSLVGVALVVLLRPFERRIRALQTAAERFGDGDLGARSRDSTNDALGGLGRSFDDMADRIGGLVGGQRELLRAISHELRTPLARLYFLIDEVREAGADDEARDRRLERVDASIAEMNALVEELLDFVRLEGGSPANERALVEVPPLVEDARRTITDLRADVTVSVDAPAGVVVRAAPRELRRALSSVAANAARHARSSVKISVFKDGDEVTLRIDDDGPGVPPSDRERIFEPFTRLDASRRKDQGGAGLGLAIVRRVVVAHGGRVAVGAADLGGARFDLVFPAASTATTESSDSL